MPIKMSPENIVAFKILPIYYLNTKVEHQCFTISELPYINYSTIMSKKLRHSNIA